MTSRRAFLRSLGSLAGAAGVGLVGGCTGDRGRAGAASGPRGDESGPDGLGDGIAEGPSLRTLDRPTLRPWASDIVWVDTPGDELPVAYVSMEQRRVFVDHAYRDRATWLLRAHISVSTALWRIPLAGDPERQPIMPGDEEREFEELPMRAWDPSMRPAMDDIRIVRGRARTRSIDFDCVPLAGGGGVSASADGSGESWLSGGPIEVVVSDRTGEESIREDFRILGTGARWPERTCATESELIQLVGWARRV